jgi:hypothetical protein
LGKSKTVAYGCDSVAELFKFCDDFLHWIYYITFFAIAKIEKVAIIPKYLRV